MNKKSKIILSFIILLIIIISISVLIIMESRKYTTYIGTIIGIDNESVFVTETPEVVEILKQSPACQYSDGTYDYTQVCVLGSDYRIMVKGNTIIKAQNGKRIKFNELRIGDKVRITYNPPKRKINKELYDIKRIEVIE